VGLFCQTAVAGDIRSALIEIPNRAVASRPGAAFVTIQGDEPRQSVGRGRCLGKRVHAGPPDPNQVDLRGGDLTCARKPCRIGIGTGDRAGEGGDFLYRGRVELDRAGKPVLVGILGDPSLTGLGSWSGAGLGVAAIGFDLALAGPAISGTLEPPPCPAQSARYCRRIK